MGHLINPITYRLGKTKFWNFIWSNKTKKNYKNYLVEDLNFHKFLTWLFSILHWNKVGVFINDFKIIKSFDHTNVNLFFFMKKLKLFSFHKKLIFNFFINNNFLNFFFKFLFNKKFKKSYSFFFKKKNKVDNYKTLKNKKAYKSKKISKIFLKSVQNLKKKKKKQKKLWLNTFLFKYCFFFIRKNNTYKKQYLKFFNSFIVNKNFNLISFLQKKNIKNFSILQKNLAIRSFNYIFFFRILSLFLAFFVKKIFFHSKIYFNFFQKNTLLLNAKAIKSFIRFSLASSNRNKVAQIVKKIFRKTKKKYYILGLKIGFFGRYEKKLRNKNVWQMRGSLSPSNINTPIMHKNFCILLKQGLCGVKISLLNKLKKNEIFKKKTLINKTFKFIKNRE